MSHRLICGDALEVLRTLEPGIARCCVTSPPYWGLRDYGVAGQLGLEPTPEEYVSRLVEVFREVRRVLVDDGTLWLNLGDSYADRPTKSHEYLFLLANAESYYYDQGAIREPWADGRMGRDGGKGQRERNVGGRRDGFARPSNIDPSANGGRNRRDVWHINTQPFPEAHFAVMPEKLVEPCILAGSAEGDLVLDPFAGAGTVGVMSLRLGRRFLGIELNPQYVEMAERRIAKSECQRRLI